jgi:hypothetical protein
MEETHGDMPETEPTIKPEGPGEQKAPAPDAAQGQACSLKACPFSSPKTLAFLLPFIAVMLLDYFAVGPFCSGSVCHSCLVTKTALASLAGFIGLLLYNRFAKRKKAA